MTEKRESQQGSAQASETVPSGKFDASRAKRIPVVYPAKSRYVGEPRSDVRQNQELFGLRPPAKSVQARPFRQRLPAVRRDEERLRWVTVRVFGVTCVLSAAGIVMLAYTLVVGG